MGCALDSDVLWCARVRMRESRDSLTRYEPRARVGVHICIYIGVGVRRTSAN